jgi:porin
LGRFDRRALLILLIGAIPVAAAAEPPPAEPLGFWQRDQLLGDALGLRTKLAEHGIGVELSVTQFYQGLAEGENQQSTQFRATGKGDLFVKVDGEKAGLWKGLFVETHGELRYGANRALAPGTNLLPVNTAPLFPEFDDTKVALSSLVVTQFLSEWLAVTAGRIDFVDLYEKPFTGGRGVEKFMNMSFTVPPLMAGTVPPVTAFGAGVIVLHELQPVGTFLVYDPRNSSTDAGFEDLFGDVAFMGEVTLPVKPFGRAGHYAIGGEYSTRNTTSLEQNPFVFLPFLDVDAEEEGDAWSVHFTFDQMLWSYGDPVEKDAGFGVFGMVGWSDGNPSPIEFFAHAGFGGQSPIPTRRRDRFGIGWFYAGVSDDLKDTANVLFDLGNEQGVEVFYDVAVTGWFHLAGDVQVIEPFANHAETGTYLGLRGRIDF